MPVRTHKQHRISHLPHADELEASRRRLLAMTDHDLGLSPFKTTPDKPIPSSPTIPPQYPQPQAPPSRRHGAASQGAQSARSLGSTASSSRRRCARALSLVLPTQWVSDPSSNVQGVVSRTQQR